MNETPATPVSDSTTATLRRAYYRRLVVLVVAVTLGALAGAWIAWNYTGDGSLSSALAGQSAVFGCAAVTGVGPLLGALGARRRWRAALPAATDTTPTSHTSTD